MTRSVTWVHEAVKPEVTNNIRRFRFGHNEMTQAELARVFGVALEGLFSLKCWEPRRDGWG